jgi:putative spermidine/putrescine transport system permease protein
VPLSFSSGTFLTFPLPGVSLRWYQEFFTSAPWQLALRNSLIVASATTVIATVLGTLAALGLTRADFPGKTALTGVIISPMIVPLVIVAVGVYFFYAPLGLTGSLVGLTLAHTALAVPFVVITVTATLQGFDRNQVRAGASLGASPAVVFFRVTLPLILPGVISGALFAFVTSFDEVVVALFVTGPAERTLPRQMFNGIRENISPVIAAAATLLIALSVLLMATVEALRRRNERLRGLRPS